MPNRKKAPPGMYTASEAIAVIGIPSTNFYALVEEKTINRVVLPDRKEGYYSKSEVDNYARNLKAFQQPYSAEKLHFGLALNEDIPAIHALRLRGRLLNRTIPVDDIMPFLPNTTLSLYVAEMAVKHADAFIKNNEPDPDKPDPIARLLGARLIRETIRFINGLKKQGTTINELYAVGTSPFGI